MNIKNNHQPEKTKPDLNDGPKDRKPGKSAHGKRGGEDDTSGGSRQGNAGQESDRYGSFGSR
jgi:hypothetical protein